MIDRSQLGSMKNDLCVDSLAHLQAYNDEKYSTIKL